MVAPLLIYGGIALGSMLAGMAGTLGAQYVVDNISDADKTKLKNLASQLENLKKESEVNQQKFKNQEDELKSKLANKKIELEIKKAELEIQEASTKIALKLLEELGTNKKIAIMQGING